MMNRILLGLTLAVSASASAQMKDANYVSVTPHESDRRVDVTVGGQPFTSYIWPTSLKKPVLYPLRSASGVTVTRGFPLDPRPSERVDHPHHAGLWFNFGDVNGLDFWNNSDSIKAANAPKMGTIVHRSIRGSKSGAGEGSLDVTMDWVNYQNKPLLREDTRYVFRARSGVRTIERITTLTALDTAVTFHDNKEGMVGFRLARQLEQPSLTPEKYTDASGRVTNVPKLDTAGVHGLYTSSEGTTGDAVWSSRAKWTMLNGDVDGKDVTLAILDNPANMNYPGFWHARGYGLFALNPFGSHSMVSSREQTSYTLPAKQSMTWKHEFLILDGKKSPADVEKFFGDFAK